jgi:hypothetical protein
LLARLVTGAGFGAFGGDGFLGWASALVVTAATVVSRLADDGGGTSEETGERGALCVEAAAELSEERADAAVEGLVGIDAISEGVTGAYAAVFGIEALNNGP